MEDTTERVEEERDRNERGGGTGEGEGENTETAFVANAALGIAETEEAVDGRMSDGGGKEGGDTEAGGIEGMNGAVEEEMEVGTVRGPAVPSVDEKG